MLGHTHKDITAQLRNSLTGEGIQGIQVLKIELVAQVFYPRFQGLAFGELYPASQLKVVQPGECASIRDGSNPFVWLYGAHFNFSK